MWTSLLTRHAAACMSVAITVMGFALAQPRAVHGQDFPGKTARIVASQAGGGGDFVARVIAQSLTKSFKQQVVVENRGGGVIAGELVAKSPPDGYTMLLYGNTFWLLPLMRAHMPYDPHRDFLPVAMTTRAANFLVVHPSLPVKSLKELLALARARPGDLNYASAAPGTVNHLAAELLRYMGKVNIVRISYRGSASALTSVISGDTQLMFAPTAAAKPQIDARRVRPLAVSTQKRSPVYPNIPTIAEAGLPGFQAVSVHGVFVPARTPGAIVAHLQREIARALAQPDSKEKLARVGVDPVGSTTGEFKAFIDDEVARLGKVIREAGIREK